MISRRWIVPALLVLLVVALRIHRIADNSITQDESTMILFAKGVLERGYPFIRQAHSEFVISTYELVPYPLALSIGLFGPTEFGARLPAVVFSAGSCLLILHFASRLFDRRVGILAALLFAVLPWAVYWGSNAFYPSQVQFFTLLTTMAIYRLIEEERPSMGVYYAILGSFSASYLSWEGSGFVLPVFVLLILFFRWGRWQWAGSVHGYIAATSMLLVIIGQLTYRTLLRDPYLGILTGRADVSFATIAFTSVGYDPYFYLNGLTSEAHLLIAATLVIGCFFLPRARNLTFLYLLALLTMLFLTSALGYYALRYIYLALPSLLIATAAVSVMLADRLVPDLGTELTPKLRALALLVAGALHLSVTLPSSLKPVEALSSLSKSRPYELRQDLSGFSFRSIAQSLEDQIRPGDALIVQAPFPFEVYTGRRGDYFLQSVTASSIFYDPASKPFYTDKWVANPVIRNLEELYDVLTRHHRVWLVSAPDGASRLSVGDDLYAVFEKHAKLVTESADGRLFLWER